MQKNLILLFTLALYLLIGNFSSGQLLAATPHLYKSHTPGWILPCKSYSKKPLARDIKDGAYSELIEEQINVEEKATYNHIITDIVSESGVQNNSEISVSFDPSFERVDFHEIIVWRDNKPQERLKLDAFKLLPEEKEIDKFIYNGTYSAKYILADIRKGDRVEYAYTVTGRNPIFGDKYSRSIYMQGSNPIMHTYTVLLVSASKTLNSKPFNQISPPKISAVNGLKRYEWEDFAVPGVSTNKVQPAWLNQYAHVQFSEYKSWAEVINWGLTINPIQTTFSGELANVIVELKKKSGNDQEKYFRLAVAFVQNEIRYTGIETGSYSHKANMPANVLKQRYGDCKDKSLLLASILNADGIEAHMALTNTDLKEKLQEYIPSPVLFNHAVVVAIVKGKQVWVDATMSNQGGRGTDLYFPAYRKALILEAGNNGLTDIKETKTGRIVCLEKYKIKDEVSPVEFIVATTYTLNQADDERDQIASNGIAQTEKDYLDYYSKVYNKIEAADSIKIKDDKAKNELTVTESYIIDNFFKRDSVNKKYIADFYADYISSQLPSFDSQVKTPVAVNYPYNIDYTIKVTMPGGWDIDSAHYAITRNSYKFTSDRTVSDVDLILRYRFSYLKDFVPGSELSDFKKDIKDLKDDKLGYSFFFTPDIKIVPFQLNYLMLVITLISICACSYTGVNIYKRETRDSPYYDNNNAFRPVLGGWLIWLVVVLFATAISLLYNLIDDGYYSISKWDLITVGMNGVMHRILLAFEVAGNVSLICFSTFCAVLVLNKRDISPYYLKSYYLIIVAFLFIDYFFSAFVKQEFSNYGIQQIIRTVIVAALWTYYLNVSNRVRETFVVPYPK